jgi:hypothetical protein
MCFSAALQKLITVIQVQVPKIVKYEHDNGEHTGRLI